MALIIMHVVHSIFCMVQKHVGWWIGCLRYKGQCDRWFLLNIIIPCCVVSGQLSLLMCRLTSAQRSAQQLPSKIDALQTEWNEAETKFDHQQVLCVFVCICLFMHVSVHTYVSSYVFVRVFVPMCCKNSKKLKTKNT